MKKMTAILITVMTMAGLITFNTAIAANGNTAIEIDKNGQVASLSITPEEMEKLGWFDQPPHLFFPYNTLYLIIIYISTRYNLSEAIHDTTKEFAAATYALFDSTGGVPADPHGNCGIYLCP